jgi:hypothetical protein
VVRGHDDHDHNGPNETRSRRNATATGISVLETKQKAAIMAVAERALRVQKTRRLGSLRDGSGKGCLSYVLTEGQISLYSCHVCVVDARRFAQPAPAFCVFY